MTLNYTNLVSGESDTEGTYEYLRYQMLLWLEEGGDPANVINADIAYPSNC